MRVIDPATAPAGTLLRVVTGSQAQNMQRMGPRGCADRWRCARRARDGWDGEAVAAALVGSQDSMLW